MNVTDVTPLGFHDGSAVMFEVDRMPHTHKEFSAAIASLPLTGLFGLPTDASLYMPDYESGYTMTRTKDGKESRDWWAGDHIWHTDGTPRNMQPVFTVIGCVKAEQGCPSTEFIDTSELLDRTLEDGFWETHDVDLDDLRHLRSTFAESHYYEEALPHMQSLADPADAAVIASKIAEYQQKKTKVLSGEDPEAANLKIKTFPLIRLTPVKRQEALFIDGGVRNAGLVSIDGTDYTDALNALRETYLAGNKPYQHGLVKSIGWTANSCVIFPQIGSLHRAMPGNDHDRALHLSFLVGAR